MLDMRSGLTLVVTLVALGAGCGDDTSVQEADPTGRASDDGGADSGDADPDDDPSPGDGDQDGPVDGGDGDASGDGMPDAGGNGAGDAGGVDASADGGPGGDGDASDATCVEGAERACQRSNDAGTCYGTERCDDTGVYQGCTAAEAVAEVCNGADDDCDGLTDEAVVEPSTACEETTAQGTCTGTWRCADPGDGSRAWLCDAGTPATEVCDYFDNDCDGAVDETFKTGAVYTDTAHCGACGQSCSGAIANGSARCDGGESPPRCEVESCDVGHVDSGGLSCIPIALGLCAPCLDASTCAVPGSECSALDDGSFCLSPCTGNPDCPAGFSCTSTGAATFCVPDTNACLCDGSNTSLQRACQVTYENGTSYDCVGVQSCTVTGWGVCQLPDEICNGFDDDCNGEVDEGFVELDGSYIGDTHCGSCGNDCTLLDFGGSPGVCNTSGSTPVCSLQCDGGCVDANAHPGDGCECCDPMPEDFPDPSGVDADCDGVDGDVALALFVAPNGDDGNAGTIDAPLRTIQAGIDAAVGSGAIRDVYVAAGIYVEAVTLAEGIGVYGGYAADFRVRDVVGYETTIFPVAPDGAHPGTVNAIDITGAASGGTVLDGFTVRGFDQFDAGASTYAIYVRDCDQSLRIANNRVIGGRGGDGSDGGAGDDGNDGYDGAPGLDALDVFDAFGTSTCTSDHHSQGGAGATGLCGETDVSGGNGGERTCPAYDNLIPGETDAPVASESGSGGASNGGVGGAAGRDVWHQAFSCTGYETFGGTLAGTPGERGGAGDAGDAGSGCAGGAGTLDSGLWQAAAGTNGSAGGPGGGGGGGGSGAGAATHNSCNTEYGSDNLGGSGGGGGSGGCGGTPGEAGQSGGGSFGIFVSFLSVPTSVPSVVDNTVEAGRGGDGGDGGRGGDGGDGGGGGDGGAPGGSYVEMPPATSYPAFGGGAGGGGGPGGAGGGGGGGCAGPTYGLWVAGQGANDLSAWQSGNSFTPGAAATPGGGGHSPGNPGSDAATAINTSTNLL